MVKLELPGCVRVLPANRKSLIILMQNRLNNLMAKNLRTVPKALIMTNADFTPTLRLPPMTPKPPAGLLAVKG